jgi:hypothetical protein
MTASFIDLLAPFRAAVVSARLRLDKATTYAAYNLALANYQEAKATLRGAQQSIGTTCLAA